MEAGDGASGGRGGSLVVDGGASVALWGGERGNLFEWVFLALDFVGSGCAAVVERLGMCDSFGISLVEPSLRFTFHLDSSGGSIADEDSSSFAASVLIDGPGSASFTADVCLDICGV